MSAPETGRRPGGSRLFYAAVTAVVAAATVGVLLLLVHIRTRQDEAREHYHAVVKITEETVDPAVWGRNFPRQYDSYRRTVDTARTRHGGSDAFSKLEQDPRWVAFFAGYAFGVDYREERGHAYMLIDQRETKRVTEFHQPGACIHCHAATWHLYREMGAEAGAVDSPDDPYATLMRGFEIANPMPLTKLHQRVDHPITCGDCHDPATMNLRVTRPAFLEGIARLAASGDDLPWFPSIERWRAGDRQAPYDPNRLASRQEMRSFVCGQCHVEYYFDGPEKHLTFPWHRGATMDAAEQYYDEAGFRDWTHARTGAPMLKAQHPEFEIWNRGIHARSGVACADCHMPYVREGAVKVSSHHVRSPLLDVARSCQPCHKFPEGEMLVRAEAIQDRTKGLMDRAEAAVMDLIEAVEAARARGADTAALAPALDLHRKSQWRLDYVAAENAMGFHAPQEAARILAESIDLARQGVLAAERAGRRR